MHRHAAKPSRHARALVFAAAAVLVAGSAALADGVAYSTAFDKAPGDEWSVQRWTRSPAGEGSQFMGPMGNETATLTVKNLPDHTHVIVSFDLNIIGDWTGTTGIIGPCEFELVTGDGAVLLHSSFANPDEMKWLLQSYPDKVGVDAHRAGMGSTNLGELGYVDALSGQVRDSMYRVSFTIRHTGGEIALTFRAKGLASDAATWGLDNVIVETVEAGDEAAGAVLAGVMAGGHMVDGSVYTGAGSTFFDGSGVPPYLGGGVPTGGGGVGGGGGGGDPRGGGGPTVTELPAPSAAVLLGLAGAWAGRRRRVAG